jgi:N-glycosylase/DNA lyase
LVSIHLDIYIYIYFCLDELDKPDLEKRLRELNFGYRARYIQGAIKYLKYTVNDVAFFDRLKSLPVKDARNQLLKIMGVGRKVNEQKN